MAYRRPNIHNVMSQGILLVKWSSNQFHFVKANHATPHPMSIRLPPFDQNNCRIGGMLSASNRNLIQRCTVYPSPVLKPIQMHHEACPWDASIIVVEPHVIHPAAPAIQIWVKDKIRTI